MSELALLGGAPVRRKPFMSRPHVDDNERAALLDCLEQGSFSRFVGSPMGDYRRYLAMSSAEAAELEDFWSVLGGHYVRRFEKEFAALHEARFAVCMNSATSAITAGLLALGVGPGDEVVTTPYSFTASATGIHLSGASVRFADVDPGTMCITPESVDRVVTDKTRAVMPVHIMGSAGHVLELEEYCSARNLILVEDSAQALTSRRGGRVLGTIGAFGVFSFQESKNIMTGEGGMAVTNDPETAYRLRLIRNHGEAMVNAGEDSDERIRAAQGYNFRLSEPLAAMGLCQTRKLPELNALRASNQAVLARGLTRHAGISVQTVTNDPGGYFPYCAAFVFDAGEAAVDRERFTAALRAEGIPCATGFPRLMNDNPLFAEGPGRADPTPNARELNEARMLGFFQVGHPNTAEDMGQIIEAVDKIFANLADLRAWSPSASAGFTAGR